MARLSAAQNKAIRILQNLKEHRRKEGLNQSQFWSAIGVTQSGGSRYEAGREVPTPTAILLALKEMGCFSEQDLAAARAVVEKARAN